MMRVEPSGVKREVLEELLGQSMVMITLDTRVEGVDVPSKFKGDPQLRLNISYRFGLPLDVNDEGVLATLTFGGQRCEVAIPWKALYIFAPHDSGPPVVFPADLPLEFVQEHVAPVQPKLSEKPKLRVIRNPDHTTSEQRTLSVVAKTQTTNRKRGHLTVVK